MLVVHVLFSTYLDKAAQHLLKGCVEKKALSDVSLTTRFSFQIALDLFVKQKEKLTLHQVSLGALFHTPLQFNIILNVP